MWEWVQRAYRYREVPWSALSKQENQQIQLYISGLSLGLRMGELVVYFKCEAKGLRTRGTFI